MTRMKLINFLQKYTASAPLGGEAGKKPRLGVDDAAYDDLRLVQKTNEVYFKSYWATLIVIYLLTIAIALFYRDEMGGLAAVLSTGGVIQSGLIFKLSNEWKEKVRIDIIAALSRRLSPDQLQIILSEMLQQVRK